MKLTPRMIIMGHQHKYEMHPRRQRTDSWDIRVGSWLRFESLVAQQARQQYECIGDVSSGVKQCPTCVSCA